MGGYMKKFIYIILIIVISCTAVACGKVQSSASSDTKKGKEVKSDLIIADRDIDTFKFTNASLIVNDNSSTFKVFMTNLSNPDRQNKNKSCPRFPVRCPLICGRMSPVIERKQGGIPHVL